MKQLIIIVFFFPILLFSQIKPEIESGHNDTLSKKYILDIAQIREHIYSQVPEKLKKDFHERMCYAFADQSAYGVSKYISKGNVYSDWKELEDYINEIVKKVMPEELRNDSFIHAYIIQDGNINAFMTPTGHIFINIGLFAEVYNEAELAGIIVHELAHYYFKHSLYYYIEAKTGEFDRGLIPIFNDKIAGIYSIKQEFQADSMAMIWLKNTHFNIKGLKSVFEMGVRLEKNERIKTWDEDKIKETDHPSNEKRLSKFNDFINRYQKEPGEFFLIDENKFNEFKEIAKPEILKYFLNHFEYYSCIEKAFKFHIFDPDNKVYVYYLLESIRRKCYMDVSLWNELFITNRYYEYDSNTNDPYTYGKKMKDNLFKKLNSEILMLSEEKAADIKAKFYWEDKPRFTTYEEAYTFFDNVSRAFNDNECILSNALSYTNNQQYRNKLLKIYLSKEDIKHRDFAHNLLNDSIYTRLSKKKLLVFDNITTIMRQGKYIIPIRNHSSQTKNELACIFDSILIGNTNFIPIFLNDFKNNHLNDYKILSDLEDLTSKYMMSKGEKTELHILDPKIWEFFNKYNVNEIEFINCQYFEENTSDKSIDAYKKVMNTDYNSIFMHTYGARYLDTYISSVREIKDGVMKVRHRGYTFKLKSKISGYKQIVTEIQEQLAEKEKKTKELDRNYQVNK